MSYKVLFMERTADGDNAMDIDREEMAETEVASVAEEEEYHLRALELSSLYFAEKVRENGDRGGGGRGGEDTKRKKRAGRGGG